MKFYFYLLSFTWGLPLTVIGCVVAAGLLLAGHRPKRWGLCWYFELGEDWGGVKLGVVFIVNRRPSRHVRCHEYGHAIQNCWFGPLMLPLVCVPSAVRYWWREYRSRRHPEKALPPYDSVWFEGQATRLGAAAMEQE